MAGIVAVDSNSIKKGIKVCDVSKETLESAVMRLENRYRDAGSGGWNDSKYRDLGVLVGRCTSALKKPILELEDCRNKLEALLREIEEYESVKIV